MITVRSRCLLYYLLAFLRGEHSFLILQVLKLNYLFQTLISYLDLLLKLLYLIFLARLQALHNSFPSKVYCLPCFLSALSEDFSIIYFSFVSCLQPLLH